MAGLYCESPGGRPHTGTAGCRSCDPQTSRLRLDRVTNGRGDLDLPSSGRSWPPTLQLEVRRTGCSGPSDHAVRSTQRPRGIGHRLTKVERSSSRCVISPRQEQRAHCRRYALGFPWQIRSPPHRRAPPLPAAPGTRSAATPPRRRGAGEAAPPVGSPRLVRHLGPAHIRGGPDGREQVLERGPMQHVLPGDGEDHPAPPARNLHSGRPGSQSGPACPVRWIPAASRW
jgi:hypothetical protein